MGFFSRRRGSGGVAQKAEYSQEFLNNAFSSSDVKKDIPRISRPHMEKKLDFSHDSVDVSKNSIQNEKILDNKKNVKVISLAERRDVVHSVDIDILALQTALINNDAEYRFHIIQGKDDNGTPYNTNPVYWKGLAKNLENIVGGDFHDVAHIAGNIAHQIDAGNISVLGKYFSFFESEVNGAFQETL